MKEISSGRKSTSKSLEIKLWLQASTFSTLLNIYRSYMIFFFQVNCSFYLWSTEICCWMPAPCHVLKNWIGHLLFPLLCPALPGIATEEYISRVPLPNLFLLDSTKRYWQEIGRRKEEKSHRIPNLFSLIKQCLHEVASSATCFLVIPVFKERLFIHGLPFILVSPAMFI